MMTYVTGSLSPSYTLLLLSLLVVSKWLVCSMASDQLHVKYPPQLDETFNSRLSGSFVQGHTG